MASDASESGTDHCLAQSSELPSTSSTMSNSSHPQDGQAPCPITEGVWFGHVQPVYSEPHSTHWTITRLLAPIPGILLSEGDAGRSIYGFGPRVHPVRSLSVDSQPSGGDDRR